METFADVPSDYSTFETEQELNVRQIQVKLRRASYRMYSSVIITQENDRIKRIRSHFHRCHIDSLVNLDRRLSLFDGLIAAERILKETLALVWTVVRMNIIRTLDGVT